MRTGIITQISAVQIINDNLYRLAVSMDDLSTYTLFGKINDYLQYVDKEVEFEVREDVVNGSVEEVISTIAVRSIVQAVEIAGDIVDDFGSSSLIPENSKVINVITFDSTTLKSGDVAKAEIVLVSNFNPGKSKYAKWTDFTCLDINSKAFNLRLFSNSDEIEEFRKQTVGKYVMVDIVNERRWGLQVHGDMQVYEGEVQIPSEALLAAYKLSMIIKNDKELEGYVEKFDFINTLKNTIYFEPGYHLVELMAEIMLINTLCKIFAGYDRKLLYRTAFASRGYIKPANNKFSNPILNYHRIITSDLKDDIKLIKMIDISGGVEEGDLDKEAYLSIRKQVTSIMKGRRGIHETHVINTSISNIDSEYSGLFNRGISLLD